LWQMGQPSRESAPQPESSATCDWGIMRQCGHVIVAGEDEWREFWLSTYAGCVTPVSHQDAGKPPLT